MARKRKKSTEYQMTGDPAGIIVTDEMLGDVVPDMPSLKGILEDVEKAYSLSRDIRVNRILERALGSLREIAK